MADDGDAGRNVAANPRVTLNFDGTASGGDVVVLSGVARVDPEAPAADALPAWLEKYAAQIEGFGMTPASYAARFRVPIRIRLTRVDGRRPSPTGIRPLVAVVLLATSGLPSLPVPAISR